MYTHDSTLDDSIGAWSAGVLDPGEQRSLRERVTTDDAFRAAYRAFITSRLAEVWAPVGDPLLEPDPGRPWLIASLPHLGPEQAIEAYRDELGTTWRWPGADPIRAEPRAGLVELAGDATSGPIRVGLRYAEPSLLDEAWRAVCAARSIATGAVADPARVAILAQAIGRALVSASWTDHLQRAARAFDEGTEPGEDERHATLLALDARLWLDEAAGATLAPAIVEQAERVDRALASYGNALLALESLEYADVVHGHVLDREVWWGARARLDDAVPGDLLDEVVGAMRREQQRGPAPRVAPDVLEGIRSWLRDRATSAAPLAREQSTAAVVSETGDNLIRLPERRSVPVALAAASSDGSEDVIALLQRLAHAAPELRERALDDAMRALHALPCPWLRPEVRRAVESAAGSVNSTLGKLLHEALGPRPGAVPVVVVSTTAREGHVLELRVHADEDKARGDMWRRAKEIRPAAQRAGHDGFLAVALRTGTGLPGYDFVQHTFELVRPPDLPDFTVDGDSLALPVAIAFASLWTDVQVPGDLVASARPYGTGVGPVGHVRAKAEAVCRTGGKGCRFVVHPDAADAARAAGIEVVSVSTWDEGLDAAGLLDPLHSLAPVAGPTMEVKKRLAALVQDARQQKLVEFEDTAGSDVGAWRALADTIRLLVEWLEKEDQPFARSSERITARCHGALAYAYAGDPGAAGALLEPIPLEDLPPAATALGDVVKLTTAINNEVWKEAEAVRARLEHCDEGDMVDVRGLALGTRGREALHRPDRDLPRALDLLEAALDHHLEHVPHEVPRSRCYLGNALRIAGRLDQATEQIARGLAGLDDVVRTSESYAVSTGMFLRYEHARVLLDLRRPEEAASEALASLEIGSRIGWRPLAGALRTLAWALRACGEQVECEASIETLARVVQGSSREADRRTLEEARGPYRRDGETF